MAKVTFNKLGCKVNTNKKNFDFNGQTIEVKEYLPINDKLKLMGSVIEESYDGDKNYNNPIKFKVWTIIEIIQAYTNVTFTEKQKEDPAKLYDMLVCSGFVEKFLTEGIPAGEYGEIVTGINESCEAFYKYMNSAMGVIDNLAKNYDNLNFDVSEMTDKLKDPESLGTLKEIIKKIN